MARPQPVRINTIGRDAGRDYDQGTTFEESVVITQGMRLVREPMKTPIVKNLEKGNPRQTFVADLPPEEPSAYNLHQWVEVIHPFEDAYIVADLEKTCLAGQTKELPEKQQTRPTYQ